MTEINNIAKSATQAQRTRKKKEALILYLYLLSYLISFSSILRTFSHLALELDAAKCEDNIKYFWKVGFTILLNLEVPKHFRPLLY